MTTTITAATTTTTTITSTTHRQLWLSLSELWLICVVGFHRGVKLVQHFQHLPMTKMLPMTALVKILMLKILLMTALVMKISTMLIDIGDSLQQFQQQFLSNQITWLTGFRYLSEISHSLFLRLANQSICNQSDDLQNYSHLFVSLMKWKAVSWIHWYILGTVMIMSITIHAKNVWCCGEGYFGQKKLRKKCVNRDKSA